MKYNSSIKKPSLLLLYFILLVSMFSIYITINYINPNITTIFGLFAFFSSVGILFISLFTIFGVNIRVWLNNNTYEENYLSISFRQSLLLSVLVVSILFLILFKLLSWWTTTFLIIAFIILEIIFSKDQDC